MLYRERYLRDNQVIKAARWLFFVIGGISRFVVSKPTAIPGTARWIFGNISALPGKIQHKTNMDMYRAQTRSRLAACRHLYEQFDDSLMQSSSLNLLQQNYDDYGITRWGLLYVLIRAAGCKKVIETGVAEGESTAHILQALADNGGGTLHSVDLPNQFYITDSGQVHAEFNAPDTEPGCLVPQELKKNWRLTLGRSRDVLPGVLADNGEIDVFFHDSEHTLEAMTFEYEAAWPYIRHGGYLVSDDATWSPALGDFAMRHSSEVVLIQGEDFGLGFIRKP